jgi:UPF0176 protein
MWNVAALYRFVEIQDLPALQADLRDACAAQEIFGTLLIAPEGINGTIAAPDEQKLSAILSVLDSRLEIFKGEVKYSTAAGKPFRRMKVRIKKEIITMRAPEANPAKQVGQYVTAQDWNALINDPDVTVIDTRNTYETVVGTFQNAIDPKIETFTEFKSFVEREMDPARHKKIAMFCTGGIRCEKASSYMMSKGFEIVYHLKGGILKYLENVPEGDSLWNGGCFVFDRRVAVGHGLNETPHQICYGCRFPLTPEDTQNAAYEEGVSCPHCQDQLTPDRARALRERHRQMVDSF